MSRKRTVPELVDGAIRHLRSMRQYADALAAGEITDDDIATMALQRVMKQLGGADDQSVEAQPLAGLQWVATYACDAGQPLFASTYDEDGELSYGSLPMWLHVETDAVPDVTTDPGELPARSYNVYQHVENGRTKGIYVDADFLRSQAPFPAPASAQLPYRFVLRLP